jgi:AcrR family transcriptional regulator
LANIRNPQQKRSITTKAKLESAAKKLFSMKGYHGTNARDIAEEAGVSVGSFYSYFEDKKAIFMEIFRKHSEERTLEIIRNIPEDSIKAKQGVHQIIRAILDANALSPEFHREVMALRYSDPEIEALYQRIHSQSIDIFVELLRSRQEKLRVKDIEAAAIVVCNASEEVLHSVMTFSTGIDDQRLIEALSDMIYQYLFKQSAT